MRPSAKLWRPVLVLALVACGSAAPEAPAAPPPAPAPPVAAPRETPPEPARVVALGDLHADLPRALQALALAGVVDGEGRWSGGETVLVQTGDQTDRGPDSKEVLELLMRLEAEAAQAGGRVVVTLGNHEVMNMMGDWRYVSEGDIEDFGGEAARKVAFSAEGELGRWLRERPMVARVGATVFVHGGVTPEYARMGLDRLNALVGEVLTGRAPPSALGDSSPIWYRGYVQGPEVEACASLDAALVKLTATRMVVGHTTQRTGRVLERCGGRLLAIDTGISEHYGGHLSAIEILEGDARALYPTGPEDLRDP